MRRIAIAVVCATCVAAAGRASAMKPDNEMTIAERARQMCDLAKKPRLEKSDVAQLEHLLVRVALFYHRAQITELGQQMTTLGCDPHKAPSLGLYDSIFAQPVRTRTKPTPAALPTVSSPSSSGGPQALARAVVERIASDTSPIRVSDYTRVDNDPGFEAEDDFALALEEEESERDYEHQRLEGFRAKAIELLSDLAAGRDGWGGKLLVELETELKARNLRLLIRPLPPMHGAALIMRSFMGQSRPEDSYCFASAIGPNRAQALNGGRGTNVVLRLDVNLYATHPFLYSIGKSSEVSPLPVALGHELIHGYHMVTGTLLGGRRGDDFHTDEEALTIAGIAKVQGEKPRVPQHVAVPAGEVTENHLLAERSKPLRISHTGQLTFTPRDHPALLTAHKVESKAETKHRKAMEDLANRLKGKTLSPGETQAHGLVVKIQAGLQSGTPEERRAVLVREVQDGVNQLGFGVEYRAFNMLCELEHVDMDRVREVFGELEPSLM